MCIYTVFLLLTIMLIQAKRIERFLASLQFPYPVLAATSSDVAVFLQDDAEARQLLDRHAVVGVASRSRLKTLRFVSLDAQNGFEREQVTKESPASRAIAAVDLEQSEAGFASYVLRRATEDGRFEKFPSFQRKRAA